VCPNWAHTDLCRGAITDLEILQLQRVTRELKAKTPCIAIHLA
jgi:hypothetical protein